MATRSGQRQGWRALGGFAVLAVLALVSWLVARALWDLFRGLQKEVAAALVAGVATIVVSMVSVSLTRYHERRRDLEREIRNRRVPTYEQFIGFWMDTLLAGNAPGAQARPVDESRMFEFFKTFTQDVLIWGSDDIVRQWSELRRAFATAEQGANQTETMFKFEQFLLALRREFGHKNKNLKRGDVLGLFVNDIADFV